MNGFELEVRNYFRTLEASSAEQLTIFVDIREAFITFIETSFLTFWSCDISEEISDDRIALKDWTYKEIQLAIRVKAGAFDTIDVQKLLHQDFLELFRYLQPNLPEKEVEFFFKHLQESKMDYLDSFRRTVSVLRANPQDGEKQILSGKMEETERKDLTFFLFFINGIMHGIMERDPNDGFVREHLQRMKDHCGLFSYKDEVLEVDAISKRNLGKMIIRYVGHEGVDDKHNLRRLLQACIDYLQNEAEGFWKNASITIYDDDDMYKIVSGSKKHQFICRMKNGEPIMIEKTASEYKKHKSTHKAPRAQTQGHPSKNHGNNCSIS